MKNWWSIGMEKNVDEKAVNRVLYLKKDKLCSYNAATKQTNAQQSSMLRTCSNMQFYIQLCKTTV